MIVKVKYAETVNREAQVEVDDEEFLEYANREGDNFETAEEAAQVVGLLKEFLEDGSPHVWQEANDPSCMGYDHDLLEAEL